MQRVFYQLFAKESRGVSIIYKFTEISSDCWNVDSIIPQAGKWEQPQSNISTQKARQYWKMTFQNIDGIRITEAVAKNLIEKY